MAAGPQRALVVEDNRSLRATFTAVLEERFAEVRAAASVGEAREVLAQFSPEVALLDVILPDGTALDVLDAFGHRCAPAVVAVSAEAQPTQAFELAARGVRVYLPKPASYDQVTRALDEALSGPRDARPLLRQYVGAKGLLPTEQSLRSAMVTEAMERAGGSVRGAAKLLRISRQLLQYILRRAKR